MTKDNRLWWRIKAKGDLTIIDCKMVSSGVKFTDDEFRGAKSRINFPKPYSEEVVRYVLHRVRTLS